MASLKDIKRRIGSVKNTQQITKAMKLVSAAKLRRAQEQVEAARPYANKVLEIMEGLAARADTEGHPLLKRREPSSVLILLIAGDKGLCGPFNSNVLKAAQQVIADNEGRTVSLTLVGKKGGDFFAKRPYPIVSRYLDYGKNLNIGYAKKIGEAVTEAFLKETYDQVYLIYNRFKNVVVQVPTTLSLLPIALDSETEEDEIKPPELVDYEYEPSVEVALDGILSLYIENQIFQALLESAASENGARMTAMDAATKNAREMIESLTLEYNTARQAAITTELIEVVTGADALQG